MTKMLPIAPALCGAWLPMEWNFGIDRSFLEVYGGKMKKLFVKNILTVCSTGILLTVLVMWSVYTSRFVSPRLNGVLLQTVHTMVVYVGSLCWFASCFFIPQAVFVICASLILWAAILFYRRGRIGMARFATVCVINGISAVLMLGYVLLFVGAVG